MALLDWLTSDLGGNPMGGGAPGDAVPLVGGPAAPSLPPIDPSSPQSPGSTIVPPLPPAVPPNPSPGGQPGMDPMTAGGQPPPTPPGMGLQQPVPLPVPRPPGANGPPANTVNPVPPPGTIDQTTMGAPGPNAPLSLAPPPTTMPAPNSQPGAPPVAAGNQTWLGRVLGIKPGDASDPGSAGNQGRQIMAGIGAGLKSVGDNWNKPGLAAFAGSAGAAIQGGTKQADTQYDQRLKSLQLAVSAQQEGNKEAFNKNYVAYLIGKNQNEKDAAAAKASGKTGAWNKPDSQKFIDAQNAMAKDPEIKSASKQLEQLQKTSDPGSPELVKAQNAFKTLLQQKQGMYLVGVGLNPAQLAQMQANPPGTAANPHVVNLQQEFDTYVQPGQYYKNPSDGKLYIRSAKGEAMKGQTAAPAQAAPGVSTAAPSALAPPGPAPKNIAADDDEDD